MPDTVQRLDLSHEALFAEPAFGLMREFPTAIKAFYETLATRFAINPAHITVHSTNTFGDLFIRLGLFNNVAALELRPDKMTVTLPNINDADSVAIAKDMISLCHTGLGRALPEVKLNASNLTLSIWIALEGGAAAAENLLSRHTTPVNPMDVSQWGATSFRNNLRLMTRNEAEGWAISVFGDPSLVPGSHLFLSLDVAIARAGLKPINQQIALVEEKLPLIFKTLGLNFAYGAHNAS